MLKGGQTNQVIKGLSQLADQYEEAVGCLKRRYDRPHLIHREHIRAILDVPSLKKGNEKEVRRLHDVVTPQFTSIGGNEERNN